MKTSIKLILIHLTVLSCVRCDEITVSGYEGGDAVINCPYPEGYESNMKYIQKGRYGDGVRVIRSDGYLERTYLGRVSLQDKKDRNIFTVTIHNLTLEDAGTYGCGVERWFQDFYTIVNLNIVDRRGAGRRTRKLVGRMAFFTCPYDTTYKDSPKYLKKRDHNVSITLIRSDGRMGWTTVGRYKLNDDRNSSRFDVHIFPLTLNDTGTYVCGVEAGEDRDEQEIKVEVYEETDEPVTSEPVTSEPVTAARVTTPSDPWSDHTSGHMAYLSGALIGALGLAGLLVVTFRLMKSRARRKRAAHSPSKHLSSARPVSGNSREETTDYENDPQDPNTLQISSAYQQLNPNTTQPDAVYQSMNPNTTQPDAVYQSLNPNTTQPDAVYQSLNPNTTQPDAVYQSLNPNTTQPDAVYQSLIPNTTEPDAVYQSLNPNTTQPDTV